MPLKLITGRANSGKTGVVLRYAFEALARGESPTIVVPQLADARRLEQELAGKAPIGVRVATGRSLAEELWQLHGDGRRFIGQATRSAIVRRVIRELGDARFAASVRGPGFERLLTRVAQQSGPEDASETDDGPEPITMVLQLLGRYRAALTEMALIEPGWVPRLLAIDPPLMGGPVGFIRFDSLLSSDRDLINALTRLNDVIVSFAWERGFAPTMVNNRVAEELIKAADEHQVVGHEEAGGELVALADLVFSDQGSLESTGAVILGVAAGMEAEAALVAQVAREAVSRGTPAERVAIVFGRLGQRINALENALSAVGLLGDFELSRNAGQTPFGRALGALLRLGLGRGDRSDALQLLLGPFSDADEDRVHRLDTEWRRSRSGNDPGRIVSDIVDLRGEMGRCMRLARSLGAQDITPDTAQQWQELADALLSHSNSSGHPANHIVDASSHQAFIRAVGEMASVSGTPFTPADVLTILPGLSVSTSSTERLGRVQLTEAARLGARRFDVVIVGGLTERESPVTTRDSFAEELDSLVGEGRGVSEDGYARLRFYSLITRARSQVCLVRQSVDSDGSPQQPSVLWEQVLDAYRSPDSETGELPTRAPRERLVPSADVSAFAPVFTVDRREARMSLVRSGESLDLRRLGRTDIGGGSIASLMAEREAFSATEIETYLRCPYQWFYGRVLRPRDVDAEMGAAELGSRAHRLIAAFYSALGQQGVPRVMPEGLEEALKLFDRVADVAEGSLMRPRGLSEELDAARARAWARQVVVDDAVLMPGFEPAGHELEFGAEVPFEFAGVPMKGRIDRVDLGSAGVFITDYKSSREVTGFAGFEKVGHIQAVVYAFAATSLFPGEAVASVYRSLRSRRLRGFWRSDLIGMPLGSCDQDAVQEEGFETLRSQTERLVAKAVEGMKAGRIPRKPAIAGACTYCGIAALCSGVKP